MAKPNRMVSSDILCFSSTDWHGIWGSRQQVMLRLARRGHRVLFVERPIGLEHWLRYPEFRRRKALRWQEGLTAVSENLWILSLPLLLPGRYYSTALNRINQEVTTAVVKRLLKRLGFIHPLLWIYNPFQAAQVGRYGESLSLYHCIDEWTAGTTGRKWQVIRGLEVELLKRVDVVFANSQPLFTAKNELNPNTFRIPTGVDVPHFAEATDPNTRIHPLMEVIPAPRLLYSGLVNDRLDYRVLQHLAESRPQWSLVLVGSPHPWTMEAEPLQKLQRLPNVHFLGKQPYADMPSILKGADVCLMPYIDDDRGHYRSPLKLYEYLTAQKPIVSTVHPAAEEFAGYVEQASTPADFVDAIETLLATDRTPDNDFIRTLERQHSWDARVDEMERILATFVQGSGL